MLSKEVWTQRRLGRLYDHFNRVFWGGQLPAYSVRWRRLPFPFVGLCDKGGLYGRRRTIYLHLARLRTRREVFSVLLHEMVHVLVPIRDDHGPRFVDELLARLPDWAGSDNVIGLIGKAEWIESQTAMFSAPQVRAYERRADAAARRFIKRTARCFESQQLPAHRRRRSASR